MSVQLLFINSWPWTIMCITACLRGGRLTLCHNLHNLLQPFTIKCKLLSLLGKIHLNLKNQTSVEIS